MARVLVTDGDERSALAVVRSLGRAGHFVAVGAPHRGGLAGASRFAAAKVSLIDPIQDPRAFASAVARAVRDWRCDLVIPVTDGSVLALLSYPDLVDPALVPIRPPEAFGRLSDKAEVARVAATLGIRVPRQVLIAQPGDIGRLLDSGAPRPPVVLKPSRSVSDEGGARLKHSVAHAATLEQASRLATTMSRAAFPLMIQERILGPGVGVFLLVWEGRRLAAFAHRRIREKPPSGGVSVLCESIPADARLLDRSELLLQRFGWSGVAMVEYKVDDATGDAVLMEVNGRFWGSLQLAIDAGVDFPALLVRAALGTPAEPVTAWRAGVRGRWLWGEADHLWTRLRHSARDLSLPPGAPSRIVALGHFLAAMAPPWGDQVLRVGDPGPGLVELARRLRGASR